MDDLDIDVDACRNRQRRLQEFMRNQDLEICLLSSIEHVQYFVGPRLGWSFHPVATIDLDGYVTLVVPERHVPTRAAADNVVTYEAQWLSTMRNDQRKESTAVLQRACEKLGNAKRVGAEFSSFSQYAKLRDDVHLFDIEPCVYRLRRRKDKDELKKLEKAIGGTARMYETARDIIRPGVNELDVFNQLQATAVNEFGEMLTGTGNDYQCGSRGGAPRNRECQAGELYILDLGPAFRGYFADNARTIAVSDVQPEQMQAWRFIVEAFRYVEDNVKPGKRCQDLFHEVKAILDECPVGNFNHHLGHGIGLFPHEAPHLNPHWDDEFEIGDVFTVEPGLYCETLSAGMRIENDYVVVPNGIRCLTHFPLDLKL